MKPYKIECYNCGKQLDKRSKTREHIPAKGLFKGFNKKLYSDVIIVPACKKCNHFFSKKTDEEFRNLVAAISKNGLNDGLKPFAERGILRNFKEYSKRLGLIRDIKVIEFDFNIIKLFHLKNLKGLIKHEYGFSMTDDKYDYLIDIDETRLRPATANFLKYFEEDFPWKVSGHEEIFKYKLFKIEKQELPFDGYPFKDSYACLMVNNNTHMALILGINKTEFESEKKRIKQVKKIQNK